MLQQHALAFLTDHGPTRAVRQPHLDDYDTERRISVSLDHAVWFHRPASVERVAALPARSGVDVGQPGPRHRHRAHGRRRAGGDRGAGGDAADARRDRGRLTAGVAQYVGRGVYRCEGCRQGDADRRRTRIVPVATAYTDQASRGDGPQTARGQRTRSALLAAARTVFEERGYPDTRVVDITQQAKVSYGSFYTYFPSKEAVFAEVVETMTEDFRATVRSEPTPGCAPADLIERTNRGYLRAYRQNAAMMAILEQAAHVNADLMATRREARTSWLRSA